MEGRARNREHSQGYSSQSSSTQREEPSKSAFVRSTSTFLLSKLDSAQRRYSVYGFTPQLHTSASLSRASSSLSGLSQNSYQSDEQWPEPMPKAYAYQPGDKLIELVDEYVKFSRLSPLQQSIYYIRQTTDRYLRTAEVETLVQLLILGNCVTLALYDPTQKESTGLFLADMIFNVCFTIEVLVRTIASGGFANYLKSPWNVFDSVMVIIGYTSLLTIGSAENGNNAAGKVGVVKALKALRALRPLRTITRFQSLRSVVVCFIEALPLLMSVLLILVFIIYLFSIAALQMFTKSYHSACFNLHTYQLEDRYRPDQYGCKYQQAGYQYRACPEGYFCQEVAENLAENAAGFDNIALSMMTVFQTILLSGWFYIMNRCSDTIFQYAITYFLVVIVVGTYFMLNLFLAVLKLKFANAQQQLMIASKVLDKQKGSQYGTINTALKYGKIAQSTVLRLVLGTQLKQSKLSVKYHKLVQNITPKWQIIQQKIRVFVEHNWFTQFLIVCIFANTALLAVEYHGMSDFMKNFLKVSNLFFTVIFTMELSLKYLSLGVKEYIEDSYNIFDTGVVIMSLVEILISRQDNSRSNISAFLALRVLKSLRVLRVVKVFKYLQTLRKLSDVFISSLSSFMAIGLLMILFQVLFAIIGLHVFGGIQLSINEHSGNFSNFPSSFRLVFQLLTLENFDVVYYSVIRDTNWWSGIYFISWIILGRFTFLTLFLAVTLDAFESKYNEEDDSSIGDPNYADSLKQIQSDPKHRASKFKLFQNKVTPIMDYPYTTSQVLDNWAEPSPSHSPECLQEQEYRKNQAFKSTIIDGNIPSLQAFRLASSTLRDGNDGIGNQDYVRRSLSHNSFSEKGAKSMPRISEEGSDNNLDVIDLNVKPSSKSESHGHLVPGSPDSLSLEGSPVYHEVGQSSREKIPSMINTSSSKSSGTYSSANGSRRLSLSSKPQNTDGIAPSRLATMLKYLDVDSQWCDVKVILDQKNELSIVKQWTKPDGVKRRVSAQVDAQVQRRVFASDANAKKNSMHIHTQRERESKLNSSEEPDMLELWAENVKSTSFVKYNRSLSQTFVKLQDKRTRQRGSSTLQQVNRGFPTQAHTVEDLRQNQFVQGLSTSQLQGFATERSQPPTVASPFRYKHHALRPDLQSIHPRYNLNMPQKIASPLLNQQNMQQKLQPADSNQSGRILQSRSSHKQYTAQDIEQQPEKIYNMLENYNISKQKAIKSIKDLYNWAKSYQKSQAYRDNLHALQIYLYKSKRAVRTIAKSQYFDNIMVLCILISIIQMSFEGPNLSKNPNMKRVVDITDKVLMALFTLEAAIKIYAFTMYEYIRHVPNQVDFALVLVSIVLLVIERSELGIVKGLRVLRALKPLRTLARSQNMKIVLRAVVMSITAMGDVSIVIFLFLVIFGIMGVQLFSGQFYKCNDNSQSFTSESCKGTFVAEPYGILTKREWINSDYNFDHLGNALLSLFVTVTINGYQDIVDDAMSVAGKNKQPVPFENPLAALYFMAYVTFCSFCLLNLYVGVLFQKFNKLRTQSQGSVFLTKEQHQWMELTELFFKMQPERPVEVPEQSYRKFCFILSQNKYFDCFIMVLIIFNIIILSAATYKNPLKSLVEKVNVVLAAVFFLEAILKISALTFKKYYQNHWNKLDFILVIASFIDMLLQWLPTAPTTYGSKFDFLRVLRILRTNNIFKLLRLSRLFKLVAGLKGLQNLFTTIFVSLPALWNVGSILLLISFIYAYIGVQLFGELQYGEIMNEHTNFSSIPSAFSTLYRIATNDEWRIVMQASQVQKDCDSEKYNCGSILAIPYFVSFVIIVSIIMVNLFTAVIVENFERQYNTDDNIVSTQNLEDFLHLWQEYDDGTNTVSIDQLEQILVELGPPMGLDENMSRLQKIKYIKDFQVPTCKGRVQFKWVCYALVRRAIGKVGTLGWRLQRQVDHLASLHIISKEDIDKGVENYALTIGNVMIVVMMQRRWRNIVWQRKLQKLMTQLQMCEISLEEYYKLSNQIFAQINKSKQKLILIGE